jgi:hypothetical protein
VASVVLFDFVTLRASSKEILKDTIIKLREEKLVLTQFNKKDLNLLLQFFNYFVYNLGLEKKGKILVSTKSV